MREGHNSAKTRDGTVPALLFCEAWTVLAMVPMAPPSNASTTPSTRSTSRSNRSVMAATSRGFSPVSQIDTRNVDRLKKILLAPATDLVEAGMGHVGPEASLNFGEGLVIIAK